MCFLQILNILIYFITLTKKEYQTLIEKAQESNLPQLKDIIEFAYHTGARRGEILRMSKNHIDWNRKVITFFNTKKKRLCAADC